MKCWPPEVSQYSLVLFVELSYVRGVGSCCLDFQNWWHLPKALLLECESQGSLFALLPPFISLLYGNAPKISTPSQMNKLLSCLLPAAALLIASGFSSFSSEAPTLGSSGLIWEFLNRDLVNPRKEGAGTLQTCRSSLCPLACTSYRRQSGEMTLAAWSFHLGATVRRWRLILRNKMFLLIMGFTGKGTHRSRLWKKWSSPQERTAHPSGLGL